MDRQPQQQKKETTPTSTKAETTTKETPNIASQIAAQKAQIQTLEKKNTSGNPFSTAENEQKLTLAQFELIRLEQKKEAEESEAAKTPAKPQTEEGIEAESKPEPEEEETLPKSPQVGTEPEPTKQENKNPAENTKEVPREAPSSIDLEISNLKTTIETLKKKNIGRNHSKKTKNKGKLALAKFELTRLEQKKEDEESGATKTPATTESEKKADPDKAKEDEVEKSKEKMDKLKKLKEEILELDSLIKHSLGRNSKITFKEMKKLAQGEYDKLEKELEDENNNEKAEKSEATKTPISIVPEKETTPVKAEEDEAEKNKKKMDKLKKLKEEILELDETYKLLARDKVIEKAALYSVINAKQEKYDKLEEELDMAKLKKLKEEILKLDEKYKSSTQKEDQAALYSSLEAKKKERTKLEEKLDSKNSKKNKETTPETKTVPETKPDDKEKKKIESLRITVVLLLGQIKNGDSGAINTLLILINSRADTMKKHEILPMGENLKAQLIILLETAEQGDELAIKNLIIFINLHQTEISKVTEVTPNTTPQETPPGPPPPIVVEPMPIFTSEDLKKLDELRDLYLKAKRMRGNVFRGLFGKMFGRKLEFDGKKMDFGGKEGLLEIEKIRKEYQEKLSKYRILEIRKHEDEIVQKIKKGEMTAEQGREQITQKIVDLLSKEQDNIDNRSVNGIEKNIFEKMKTKWRQLTKTRLVTGLLLGGASILTGGTAVGAGIVGARAVMGGVGTYVGVEAGLEQFTKLLGHKGNLVQKMSKELKNRNFITDDARDMYLNSITPEEIKKEAARLRMLQVEKGVAIKNLHTRGDEGKIALMILERDNALTAREVVAGARLDNPTLRFSNRLSNRLATEINGMNETVESEVDKERIKKMFRKTTAALAGGSVGWLIGGKLFDTPTITPPTLTYPGLPVFAPTPTLIDHTVAYGDSTWKIIENQLDAEHLLEGMDEGKRTHVIDAIKDIYAKMTPTELKNLGWASGDIRILNPGDVIHLSSVFNNPTIMLQALSNSEHLSSSEITSIINNNKELSTWFVAHHAELAEKGILFDDTVTTKILRGRAEDVF